MREAATLSLRALAAVLPIAALAGTAGLASSSDPALARIAEHRALRRAIGATSGRDEDPAYEKAYEAEEAALQALGDVEPATVAGAAALLAYMAEIEGDFADPASPLVRTMLTVARSLDGLTRIA